MAFTYNPALADDVSLVRFHVGDTNEAAHYIEDETISHFLALGSVGTTVIACIRYIITQLSVPEFRQDWMSVNTEGARKAYENMLKQKAQEFSITLNGATFSTSVVLPVRSDALDGEEGA